MTKMPDETMLLDHLMNHIKDIIYFKDCSGRFVLINKEGASRTGHETPEELIGKSDLDIFTEEHSRDAHEDEQHIIQTGEPLYGKEEKETWEDGRETWVSTTKLPLRNDQGEIIGTFGISRDITDHKKAELLARHYAEENRRLYDEMQSDIQMAAALQKTFLPSSYPRFPNGAELAESAARFSHCYHSSGMVGGDFCSIHKLSETEAGILLCDVEGQGVRSALVTALMRAMVEELSPKEKDPSKFLLRMNSALRPFALQEDHPFSSTACYMVMDVASGELRYSIAGHPTPILLEASSGRPKWLTEDTNKKSIPLAKEERPEYKTLSLQLKPQDAIIMYTDGIFKLTNTKGETFGQKRLIDRACKHSNLPLCDMFPLLLKEISAFSPTETFNDDVCLIGCRFDHWLKL